MIVSVGSYHHPFDRLIGWIESWYANQRDIRLIVQHGPGRPIAGAENHAFLGWQALRDLMASCDIVMLQGGAGAIVEASQLLRIPVVVPRIPVNNEVIDDHQVKFAVRAAEMGLAYCALSKAELHALLDRVASGDLPTFRQGPFASPGAEAIRNALATKPELIARQQRWGRMARMSTRLIGRPKAP